MKKMSKIILVPDSFKGTLSAARVCEIMRDAIHTHLPNCGVVSIPVADGGEGTVDCFLQALEGGDKITRRVAGPLPGMEVNAFYGVLPDGTAVVELAAAAGLPLVAGRANPCVTTTYGVGRLMLDAVKSGCKNLVVALGGSCTNDLGCGIAAAAGARFLDSNGNAFVPVGGTLDQIANIDLAPLRENFNGVQITVMCDVNNPLHGPEGAAHVFSPQKGATPDMVLKLDAQLRAAAGVIENQLGIKISGMPGAGAAGGAGAGMVAFFGAALQSGITTMLDAAGFDQHLAGADFVFTGEGRLDSQSARGKVISGIARRVNRRVPVIVFAGAIEDPVDEMHTLGVTAMFSATRRAAPLDPARCERDLALCVDNVCRFIFSTTNEHE